MAFKMKSGNKPGFKHMGSSPVREHNMFHKTAKLTTTDKSDDGITKVNLNEVKINRKTKNTNTNTRVEMYLPGGGIYDPITSTATNTNADQRQTKKEKLKSDVNSLVSGIAGIPGDVIETVTDHISSASSWVRKGLRKRKQNKIDNPKPKKVKKVKVKKTKTDKSSATPPNLSGTSDDKKVDLSKKTGLGPREKAVSSKKVEYANNTLKVDEKKVDKTVKDNKKKARKDNIKKSWKSAKSQIGEQLVTQGVGAGIQALLTPKEKAERVKGNSNLSGFSQIQFGRRKMKE